MTSTPGPVPAASLQLLLEQARDAIVAGDAAGAERLYRVVLERDPAQPDAAMFLAGVAVQSRRPVEAVRLLQPAHAAHPGHPQLLRHLGLSQETTGDFAAAAASFESALAIDPAMFGVRLRLASLHERAGREDEAVIHYFRALAAAHAAGEWLDEQSMPPWLRARVMQALDSIQRGRSRLFNGALEPLRQQYGASELTRVQDWLDQYIVMRPPESPDPRQRPKFLYFPGLPSQPYYDRALFPFIEQIEAATSDVREEMLDCLRSDAGLEPFLGELDAVQTESYLRSDQGKPVWVAFFFYRHGQAYPDHLARCPRTAALLGSLPLVRIRDHAPEACFSVLTPGTHILPHHGVTNTRLVLHLPLLVPPGCALLVGGEQHVWQEGRCVVFDDTYLHEAWNRGDRTRAVLICDVWNPHLSEPEQLAITALVGAIGDFNRACGS